MANRGSRISSVAIANGCVVSRLTGADLPELTDLVTAIEYVDEVNNVHSSDDFEFLFRQPNAEPERNALVVRQESGHLIAYGWLRVPPVAGTDRRLFMMGGCHPAWRNRGISSLLVTWLQQRALDWYAENYREGVDELTLAATSEARVTSDDDLLRNNGFVVARRSVDMFRRLDEAPAAAHPPRGVSISALAVDMLSDVLGVYNRARLTIPGAVPLSPEEWANEFTANRYFGQSFVAFADDRVVGYVLNSVDDEHDIGWTDHLGVDPDRQRAGIGRSLLKHSLGAFYATGLVGAGIGVEGPGTMTVDMYRSLGFEVTESLLTYIWRPSTR